MTRRLLKVSCFTILSVAALVAVPNADDQSQGPFAHVLLISIDGLHASDLDWYLADPPSDSALAELSAHGRTFTNAVATKPSDSFPGILAMVTGGTPRSTGVFYDDSYDRSVLGATGVCGVTLPGARVQWKQNLDKTPFSAFLTTVDESKLPLNPNGCTRVHPNQFPKVNNVFEIVKAAGGRTAWSDKHPAYEFLNGPTGTGIDDLYTPEIASCGGVLPCPTGAQVTTNSFQATMDYDDMKVAAIVNEINGLDHTGANAVGVPTVFGMNFQAVSVGQKLDMTTLGGPRGGYLSSGMPSVPLQNALKHTDDSIRSMLHALSDRGLSDSTLVIVSAKHGNMRIDPTAPPNTPNALVRVDDKKIGIILSLVAAVAQVSQDTGPMIWLKAPAKTADAVATLDMPANRTALNLPDTGGILWGDDLTRLYGDQLVDRIPDIILVPKPGTLYSLTATKISDHGSFNDDDVRVALIVSNPRLPTMTMDEPVETRQIACTILKALSISCDALKSEQTEPSMCLPPMGWSFGHAK